MCKTNVVTKKRPPNPVADLFLEPPLSISDAYQSAFCLSIWDLQRHILLISCNKKKRASF